MYEFILNEKAKTKFKFSPFAASLRKLLRDDDYLVARNDSLELNVADLSTAESIDNMREKEWIFYPDIEDIKKKWPAINKVLSVYKTKKGNA